MKHIVVGTAGHIDHGKSALVLALTGTDPDRLKEEQARGITIDLGFAHWQTPDLSVAFVDVPGHERFVKNMLAGVGGIDAVLFVVAADESVMPQTREHFEICRLLHVPAGIIALTKADLVDQDVVDLVRLETRELVQGSFLEHAPIIPVSVRTGAGLDALKQALVDLGRTTRSRSADGPVRLPVDRVFSVKGFGTVVTGTLVSGTLAADRDLMALPAGRSVKARGIQVHGAKQAAGEAGQRVAVNLGGVEVADLTRGETLVSPGDFVATRVCDARVEVLISERPIRHGARVRLHQGTSEVLGRVAISSLVADQAGGDQTSVAEIPPGRAAYVRLRLESPLVLARGDRFILRAYSPSITIAGGSVLDPIAPRTGIRTTTGRERFRRLDPLWASSDALIPEMRALAVLIDEAGMAGVPIASLVYRLGLSPSTAESLAAHIEEQGRAVRVERSLVATATLAGLSDAVVESLAECHRAQPLADGLPREQVRERLFAHAAAGVFDRVIADLVASGRLVARDRLALASHRVEVTGEEKVARDGIERLYREAGLKPPDIKETAATLALRPDVAESMAVLLVRQRVLVRVDAFLFHEQALARLKQDTSALKQTGSGAPVKLDVAMFKGRYGISRKYAIPLLEYLDRERITRRVGDSRVVI
ncbi:MAG: selenocysteine-specific translation elongation factor [Acidobacteria bacterium]|nr:selenocysteine-specific translation elongation factor [Acidobacteriota bacterium]